MTEFNHNDFETKWYKKWENSKEFNSNVNSKKKSYAIMMPPPNVTGSLHIGHALTFTLQDILIRFYRMNNFDVLWQPGTDHAGIATQMVVERMLEKQNISRRDLGRDEFIKKIWEWKNISGNQITDQLKALGSSPDWTRERFTMDDGLSLAVKKVFINLYKDGLIYKDKRLVNWDTVLMTAISDLEVEQREVESSFWYFRYPLENSKECLIIATTRPETILGDTALAVNPNDDRYKHLVGSNVIVPLANRKIPIIADDYSDPEKGTGVVKITPAHDFNDFEVGKRHNLEIINILNENGTINKNGTKLFEGLDRFAARKKIIKEFKRLNLFEKIETIQNTVPHGDRSGSIIEPWLMDQWYVNAYELSKSAIKSVQTGETKFVPKKWEKTFFEWMNNIQPWCISRQLWWGHRIPAWYGPDKEIFVDMDEKSAHEQAKKHYKKNVQLKQDEDVLDTWFSSALWPFSTLGWPEKTIELKKYYPSNVLVTGFDIIFFWVARMIMMGTYFMGKKSPFKEVYIHALVRDKNGQKMSKSKGNVLDPLDLIKEYGADPLRFTLSAMAAQGRDIKLSKDRISGYRNFSTKIINACRFLEINNCLNNIEFDETKIKLPVNIWILNLSNSLNKKIKKSIIEYRFNDYADLIYHFVWRDYCDWYIELMKAIFSCKDDESKLETRYVASLVMKQILKFLHPLMPFITEECNESFFKLKTHLIISEWPKDIEIKKTENSIFLLIKIISALRAFRVEKSISFKNQIDLHIKSLDKDKLNQIQESKDLIMFLGKLNELKVLDSNTDFTEDFVVLPVDNIILGVKYIENSNESIENNKLLIEYKKINEEIVKINEILLNKSFVEKAPKDVVLKTKKKQKELYEKIKEIKNVINLV